MLNAICIFIISFLLGGYIQGAEYSIIPEQVRVVLPGTNLCNKIKSCKYALLSSEQIILLLNWEKKKYYNSELRVNTTIPYEILIKIFTFLNSNAKTFTFCGYLDQLSVDLIKDKKIKFPSFTVQQNKENSFCLDVSLNHPIHEEDLSNVSLCVFLKLKNNGFLPANVHLPIMHKEKVIKNYSGDIVHFVLFFFTQGLFLKNNQSQLTFFPKTLNYYKASSPLVTQYPDEFENMHFSDVIRSLYCVDHFVIAELIDEHVITGGGGYEAEFHDPNFKVATNHRIVIFDDASNNYDDANAIQKIKLPTFSEDNCPCKDLSEPFLRARFDIVDIIKNNTLILSDKLTGRLLCFALSNNDYVTFTEGESGHSDFFIKQTKVMPAIENSSGWQVTKNGDKVNCTIC